jgi:hypothetical protein
MALILAVTTTVMGLVRSHMRRRSVLMGSTELHRATVYRVLIRIGREPQLSVKMGHFLIRSIRTPAVRALAMEECANT